MRENKTGVLILMFILIFIISGCSINTESTPDSSITLEQASTNKKTPIEEKTIPETGVTGETKEESEVETKISSEPAKVILPGNETRYYFLEGIFVGSWHDNSWDSLLPLGHGGEKTKHYIKDILAQNNYTLYDMQGKVGTAAQLTWDLGLGPAGFETDMTDILAPYGKGINGQEKYRQFDLPTKLNQECADITVPHYTNFNNSKAILATNATVALLPGKTIQGEELNVVEKQKLKDILLKNGIQAEPNLTQSLRGDFDNDGKTEFLIIANTRKGEGGYPYVSEFELSHPSGSYSLVILEDDDGSVKTVFSDFRPYDRLPKEAGELIDIDNCQEIELLGVYDLNGDSRYEICLSYLLWEGGLVYVMEPEADGTFDKVMAASFGM